MPNYLSPGVYVEEVEAGSRPIEGVGTATAAFVGLAEKGPVNAPTLVTNWSQFSQAFGGFLEGSYLAHSVYGYFLNGGGSAYIVRIGADGHAPSAQAELPSAKDKSLAGYRVLALEGGQPGNDIQVEVAEASQPTDDTFKLIITRGKDREEYDTVTMLSVPDLMAAYQRGMIDADQVKAVQLAMIAHCELMGDRVAILDAPPGLNAQQIREWRVDKAGYDSKYATLYWPWVKVFDPLAGQANFVPPSGHMAGIWARSDDTRGVHKAPANEVVRGAISLELQVTKSEHDLLNPQGINVIRAFPGRGIRVWGARTLSSDPAWRYINVRRLFNYIEGSILLGTQWVVFEPNDMALWERVKRTISAFLVRVWRDGALFGATPSEAFYVKCDGEVNTAETIDAGQLIVEIGIAPVKPAEFVVFKIAQFSGGTSLSE